MAITLYELQGTNDRRFSPYAWRSKLALAHKGLTPDEIVPAKFTEKAKIEFSGQGRTPILVDGDKVVPDSWAIACNLEDTYPDRPSLFGGEASRGLAKFLNAYADGVILGGIARQILWDVFQNVDTVDRDYFRETRQGRFGKTIEEIRDNRDQERPTWEAILAALRATLKDQPFFCGGAPPRPMPITSSWAPSFGPAALAPIRCCPRATTRSMPGASGCSICMAGSAGKQRDSRGISR